MPGRLLVLLAVAVFAAGCGDDITGPSPAAIGGAWRLSAPNMAGEGVSCSLQNAPIALTQTGATFTGNYGPATLSCVAGGQSASASVQGAIISGSLDGNAVEFDLDTQDFHHTGSVSGNSMSGTARWNINLGGSVGEVTLNGNWSAART